MNGIINFLKPTGMTSSDAVVCVRKLFGLKRVGHMGTLDPDAGGVLPICLGNSTRLFDYTNELPKEYIALIRLGVTTDTMDASGSITSINKKEISQERFAEALQFFTGEIKQLPPMYSAIKYNGKKLYELARKDIEVERSERTVYIHKLEHIRQECTYEHLIRITCSKGTYIRTLCSDIGEYLGCGAYMRTLIRTESAGLKIIDSVTLEELKQKQESCILPPDSVLGHYKRFDAEIKDRKALLNGAAIDADIEGEGFRRVYIDGIFYGLALYDGFRLKMKTLLRGENGQWL